MSRDVLEDMNDFDDSPRPAKRQRTSKTTTKNTSRSPAIKRKPGRPKKTAAEPPPEDISDSDVPIKPVRKRQPKNASKVRSASISSGAGSASGRSLKKAKTKRNNQSSASSASDLSEDAFESAPRAKSAPRAIKAVESEEDDRPKQKKPKHRIHEPTDSTLLIDRFISVSQLPASSDPNSVRGPIWIQQPQPPPRPAVKTLIPAPPLFGQARPSSDRPSILATRTPSASNVIKDRPEQEIPCHKASPIILPRVSVEQSNLSSILPQTKQLTPATTSCVAETSAARRDTSGTAATAASRKISITSHISRPISSVVGNPQSLNQNVSKQRTSSPKFSRPGVLKPNDDDVVEESATGGVLPSARQQSRASTPSASSRTLSSESRGGAITNGPAVNAPQSTLVDLADELADLPSDAFCSSPERESPVLARSTSAPQRSIGLNGMSTGYRQMTLHGSFSDPKDAEQTKAKKVARPIAEKEEKPTQHKLNEDTLATWIYPVNLGTIRDYQFNIVQIGLFHNLLVALPTGLGKTFIAATIMLNWYRWTKDSQIIFVAPTKPLVAQQVEACFHTVGIPRSDTAMLTGNVTKPVRELVWKEKRVFFTTPQTALNDLSSGICDPKRIVLLVVDEAHRTTGKYAYGQLVQLMRRFNQSFRVLALTATPGSKVEAVQNVIDSLDIARTEIRTETSLDIRSYVFARDLESFKFDFSDEQEMIMDLFSKSLQSTVDKLRSQNATWITNPRKITAYGLNLAARDWTRSEAGKNATQPVKGMVRSCFQVLSSLAHAMTMLKFHGIGPFYRKIVVFRNEVDGDGKSSKASLDIRHNPNFNKMCNYISLWIKSPDFIGHPKLEHLRSVILNHFLDKGETGIPDAPSGTRVMVFAQYRDSAEEICRVLKRNEPMIRPRVFVGQAHAEGSVGMDQKTQLAAISDFKAGTFNTLVATSIGEEGLDIGEVDLIVCYDANASPVRMLQRMGRTGRKRQGKIVLLLMKEKEDSDFEKSKDNYEKMQGLITDGKHFNYHEDRSPRILPKGVKPVVDKRVVEIPTENSQLELPIPSKRKVKGKKATKQFHMPDNAITGFVKASRVRGDGSDVEISGSDEESARPKQTSKRKSLGRSKSNIVIPPPEPEGVPLPFLDDVLLNRMQERELERKYQSVSTAREAAVVQAPAPENNLAGFQRPSTIVRVQHSRLTTSIASMLTVMRDIDCGATHHFNEYLDKTDIEGTTLADHLYGDPEVDDHPESEDFVDLNEAEAEADSDTDNLSLPDQPPPKKRGRPAQPKAARAPKAPKAPRVPKAPRAPKAPAKRKPVPAAAKSKPKPKPRAKLHRTSSAMEAASSSPPPTPADMRLPSQGIALGDEDTSGDDAPQATGDWRDDSELDGFVVGSDEEIEFVSSSLPRIVGDGTPAPRKVGRGAGKFLGKRGMNGGSAVEKGKGKTGNKGKGKEKEVSNGGRGELSKEFVYDSDEENDVVDGKESSEEDAQDEVVDLEDSEDGMAFDAGADEGISARQRAKRRVIEDSSDDE
ncbi:ATP-dependent DNA helicase mph1-like protein [Elsinoe fawcettii]|nr:ATP-dependent DNA helicase mph1-like protein [Elsinoe fawcettii]